MGSAAQGRTTHVTVVVDASYSIGSLSATVIKVVDNLIKQLAEMARSMPGEEVRITAYEFADTVSCIFYDRSVQDLPSIKDDYKLHGNTALIDATLLSIADQREIPQKYGDHAFITHVITDGIQNAGKVMDAQVLVTALSNLRDNETVACHVPNANGVWMAKRLGFPAGNVAIWDASTQVGVESVGQVVAATTRTFIQNRATTGVRSTTGLFTMDASAVNDTTVKQNLTPLSTDDYKLIPVTAPKGEQAKGKHGMWEIKEFAEHSGWAYAAGETGYYQFVYIKGVKPSEQVTPGKKIIIVEKSTGIAYFGPEARTLLGLPHDKTTRIKKQHNEKYDVYISSDATNRHLPTGTKLLLFKPVPLKQKNK